MPRFFIDEVGHVYGQLTVVGRIGSNGQRYAKWECICTCGSRVSVAGKVLRNGEKQTCGCVDRRGNPYTVPMHSLINNVIIYYKRNARHRSLVWALSFDQCRVLFATACTYCGALPSNRLQKQGRLFVYSGIDRVDSAIGYVTANVVPCCRICNNAKSNLSLEEFRSWVARVYGVICRP